MTRIAVTRGVSPAIVRCELVHQARDPIDVPAARRQHERYEAALASLGCSVRSLPADPDLADSVFVEDTGVVFDELAVLTRPGAESRRPEVGPIAAALGAYRTLVSIEAPGTLDGGDVLVIGRRVYVGLSGRTNQAAIEQLEDLLPRHGYEVQPVRVRGCLHLKSAVTAVADDTVLVNPRWVDPGAFADTQPLAIDPSEPGAANALRIGDSVIYPASFPVTRRKLEAHGVPLTVVDVSELQKAEGAVTCCSLVFADHS